MAPETPTSGRPERARKPLSEAAATVQPSKAVTTPARQGRGRYIPGGPGGGGRYVDEQGVEIPVGGTGPGGYNYIGPRGRIGRENLANGVIPPVYSRKERDKARSQRPQASGARRTASSAASLATQSQQLPSQPQPPRPRASATMTPAASRSAHDRVAAAMQGQGQTPREELGYENFHPDLDLDQPFLAISADEQEGNLPRPVTPIDQYANGAADIGDTAEVARPEGTFSPVASVNGDSPAIHAPGAGARRGSRLTRETTKSYDLKTRSSAATPNPPKATGSIPPNFTQKERLNLPQPSYRISSTLARFEEKGGGNKAEGILPYAIYMDPAMIKVGYQKSDKWERPKGYIKGSDMTFDTDLDEGSMGPGRVEYDMDYGDEYWLQNHNKNRYKAGYELVSRELFEIAMTKVEVEWHALEKRFPKPNPRPPQTHRPRSSSAAAVNGEPLAGEEQDSLCAICDDGDVENTNAIVFCDGCDLAVHQECYGVPFIPEGQWLCRKCQLIGRGISTCLFCPSTEGAFKQTPNSKWAHLLCAMWIPEVSLGNTSFNEPILDVEKIPNSRWKLVCYICNQRMGACIQCSNKSCYQAFHVTCARKARLYLKAKNSLGALILSPADGVQKSYCDKHCPAEYAKESDVAHAIEETKKYFKKAMRGQQWAVNQETAATMAATNQQAITAHEPNSSVLTGQMASADNKKKGSQAEKNVTQLPSGAPVIPRIVFDIVEKSLSRFNITKRREFVAEVCKLWTLKREARRGAALLKRLQLSSENFSSMEITRRNFAGMGPSGKLKLDRRIEFARQLVEQLKVVQEISKDIVERETIKLDSAHVEVSMVDKTYFPVASLLPPIIDKALGDHKHTFTAALEDMRAKLKKRYYVSASTFTKDFCKLLETVVYEEGIVLRDRTKAFTPEEKVMVVRKKQYAKKVFKSVQPMLEEAIRAEAELCGKVVNEEVSEVKRLLDTMFLTNTDQEMKDANPMDGGQAEGVEKVDVNMQGIEINGDGTDGDVVMSSGVEAEATINADAQEEVLDKGKELDSTADASAPAGDAMIIDDAQPSAPQPQDEPTTTSGSSANERANALEGGGVPWSVSQFEPEGTSLVQPKQPTTQYHDDLSDVELDALGLDDEGEPSLVAPTSAATPTTAKKAKAKKRRRW